MNTLSTSKVQPASSVFSRIYTFFENEGVISRAILKAKYGSKHFAVLYPLTRHAGAKILASEELLQDFVIMGVPSHKKRLRERGFDHIDKICNVLSRKIGILHKRGVLTKKSNNTYQHSLNLEERLAQEQKYGVFLHKLRGVRRVLLVDDVVTTGSTLYSCGKVLKEAGVEEIRAFSLAFTP